MSRLAGRKDKGFPCPSRSNPCPAPFGIIAVTIVARWPSFAISTQTIQPQPLMAQRLSENSLWNCRVNGLPYRGCLLLLNAQCLHSSSLSSTQDTLSDTSRQLRFRQPYQLVSSPTLFFKPTVLLTMIIGLRNFQTETARPTTETLKSAPYCNASATWDIRP